ncbi:GntR family transcriptional regulator [Paracoccus jeotgali]|uniref:GntR family transcriptional regulator n=1 Tax=Paracoccus jeotgali TaxID=2065379 RepID=UPI0028AF8516|nr:GntR family transcriptional regulator [Paracoccus jeotgali]
MLIERSGSWTTETDLRPTGEQGRLTWQAVQSEILRRIRSGEWRPGQLIPTENQLAERLGCARSTVNRALNALACDGIVHRRRRVGTRVADHALSDGCHNLTTMREEVERTGSRFGYRLLSQRVVPAPEAVAAQMHLPPAQPLTRYAAQALANDAPYCFTTGYLPQLPGLRLTDEMLSQAEPLEWMIRRLTHVSTRIEVLAARLNSESAEALSAERDQPVLAVERTVWTAGRALSYSRRVYPPGHRFALAP